VNKHHVRLENSHPHIQATATISGIRATFTDVTALCPFNGETTVESATYNGSVTMIGGEGKTIDIG
jgi:hypothetical protein